MLEVTMLGGTEIGATCLWCKTASAQWLIDAGTRMDPRDLLPNLSVLEAQHAHIDAIFVTHAHQDHVGALPLISAMFPDAPVFMTKATLEITRVMLADALKLSNYEGHARVFSDVQLDALWRRVRIMGQDKVFAWNGIRVSTYTAGHILGAVAIGFETNGEGSFLFTGDFSVMPSRLISGLRVPRGVTYDLVIAESTYGSRLHESRATQERELAAQVAGVIEKGGFVLIPAFAVGRAQEVLMILQDAMRYNKQISPFRITVDGLVRSICPIYESHPHLLQGPAKRMLQTSGRLFSDDMVRFVKTSEERQRTVTGEPRCIISSSGMLNGGPSVFYASALASDAKNAVFLCGYQDEESPGRLLLDMAKQPEGHRQWVLPDRVVPVRCHVGFYGLSAHADRQELLQSIAGLRPHQVVLVHGDDEAKQTLRRYLADVLPRADVSIAEIGRAYTVEPSDTRHGRNFWLPEGEQAIRAKSWRNHVVAFREAGAGGSSGSDTQNAAGGTPGTSGAPAAGRVDASAGVSGSLQIGICRRMDGNVASVWTMDDSVISLPVPAILDSFGPVPMEEDPLHYVRGLVAAAEACIADERIYGYRAAERLGYLLARERGLLVPADPYTAESISEWLDCYGWRQMTPDEKRHVFKVYVCFPWAVPKDLRDKLRALAKDGWTYELQPHIYAPAVSARVGALAKAMGVKVSMPKIYPQEERIVIPVVGHLTEAQRVELASALQSETAGTVIVQELPDDASGAVDNTAGVGAIGAGAGDAAEPSGSQAALASNEAAAAELTALPSCGAAPRMEQNEALRHVKLEIPKEFLLQKAGLDSLLGVVRLTVAFPDVVIGTAAAEAFSAKIEAMTGWRIDWQTSVNQALIGQAAVTCITDIGGAVRGIPSLYTTDKAVRVSVSWPERAGAAAGGPSLSDMIISATERFRATTGWTLVIGESMKGQGGGGLAISAHAESPTSGRARMEANRALKWLEAAAADAGLQVFKKSLRGNAIELAFITPEFGAAQSSWLAYAADATGWPIQVSGRAQQQALIALAEHLASPFGLYRTPSVFQDRRVVAVRTEQLLPAAAAHEFESATAWKLEQM